MVSVQPCCESHKGIKVFVALQAEQTRRRPKEATGAVWKIWVPKPVLVAQKDMPPSRSFFRQDGSMTAARGGSRHWAPSGPTVGRKQLGTPHRPTHACNTQEDPAQRGSSPPATQGERLRLWPLGTEAKEPAQWLRGSPITHRVSACAA